MSEHSSSGTDHDYEHIGVVRNDTVETDDGGEYYFTPSLKRLNEAPLHSRKIAFDVESTHPALSDRVARWEIIDATPNLDASGEVVYTYCNRIYLRVDGYEDDIQVWDSDFHGEPEVGDTVLFDWHTEGTRVWNGEVKDGNNRTVCTATEQSD